MLRFIEVRRQKQLGMNLQAISAVEGSVKLIEGTRDGGLSDALNALSKRMDIHPALKAGTAKRCYAQETCGKANSHNGTEHQWLIVGACR